MKALVIDDSRAMRSLIGRTLREFGFDVVEASDGREALARMRSQGLPAIALVDWNMPDMDGFEFVCTVRRDEALRGILLMMVTTETEEAQVSRALSAGADEYLMKPFTEEALVEKLELLGFDPKPRLESR
jgi:two-component system chemotaxis response regulator CheY